MAMRRESLAMALRFCVFLGWCTVPVTLLVLVFVGVVVAGGGECEGFWLVARRGKEGGG